MELFDLINKYKQKFVFKKGELPLSEAKELLEKLKVEPIDLENEEMMWKLRNFISKQEYLNKNKNDKEDELRKACDEFDYYHEKLKEYGVKVVQPGDKYNGKTDYVYMTYHYNGEVIYKWYSGTHVTVLAPQIKEVYEVLNK